MTPIQRKCGACQALFSQWGSRRPSERVRYATVRAGQHAPSGVSCLRRRPERTYIVRQAIATCCQAHHVTVKGENRRLMLASLRYNDTVVKLDGVWLFAERLLYVDWVDERALS
jgi:hypothetical protein